jgi:hypothetical protein
MRVAVTVDTEQTVRGAAAYRWDADTDILLAALPPAPGAGTGMTGTVGIEGRDGAWLNLEVRDGRIEAIEIAVWPDVRKSASLTPPAAEPARLGVPSRPSQPGIASVEVDARITAEADEAEETIHFRLGSGRPARTVAVASDLLIELDETQHITGIWMLHVPPFPAGQ